MIHKAKVKTKITHYVIADASHLPFKDSVFHTVLSALVVNHIENIEPFLAEMLRTCRMGGELLISSIWREGAQEVREFQEYFGRNLEFTVQEHLYPPNILHKELTRLNAQITHSVISLYTDYGEGKKGVYIIKAEKIFRT